MGRFVFLLSRAGPLWRFLGSGLLLMVAAATTPTASACGTDSGILIRHVRLIDFSGTEPRIDDNQSVLVRGAQIVAVAPSTDLEASVGDRIVEGGGRTLVPGLVDMHVHIWDEAELGAYLASGVTTVRNMSGMPFLLEMRDSIAVGALAGPKIFTTGPILNSRGPNAQLNHQIVETADEARAAVQAQYDQGYRRIKVYSNLNEPAYLAILDEAARLEMPVTGHTPEGPRARGVPQQRPFAIDFADIVDDGFETIEHVESIVWHGLRNRHDRVAARALARHIAAQSVPVTPTLIAFANLSRIADTRGAHLHRAGTETLNPFIGSTEMEQFARWSSEDSSRAREQLAFYRDFTRILSEEGVLLVVGSDAGIATNIPGVALHDELDLLIESGLTPYEAIRGATVNAAHVLGNGTSVGRIRPGYRADLLLVDGDPLTQIDVLRRPVAMVVDGRLFDKGDLDDLWQSAARTDADRTARNVLGAMAAQGTVVEVPN
ncbi:amidohydrolase family protein [Sphingopyxis sp. DHUNG17]|uniref:amidohydrolase family protein n=1 Tax=Sphingopyxis jiangsuensis TaxID=2871171 RepID=UPI00191F997B|nr:amidohydrolase family protein [Sphingopyxis lutea]MBL0768258.1 amidohydrolase family protein [Sphingopyxis lutea]